MAKKKKPSTDINVTAFEILQAATGQSPAELGNKNPAAVALGRLGGLKGGKARANKLSKKRRAEIALKAAKARWKHPS
ncbi:hypothetical protein [Nitrospira sp. Nam80]